MPKPAPPKMKAPGKKTAAPMPIGKGKAGTGKRMLYEAGGGKKALAKWRGLDKSVRQAVKKTAAKTPTYDIRGTLKNIAPKRKFTLPVTKDSPFYGKGKKK